MRTVAQAKATTRFKIAAIDRLLLGLSGNSAWCDVVTLSRADIACIPYTAATAPGQQASIGSAFASPSRDIAAGNSTPDLLAGDAKHTRKVQRRARTALAVALTLGTLVESKHLSLRELLNRCTTALNEAESYFKSSAPPVAPLLPERRNWRTGTYAWQSSGSTSSSAMPQAPATTSSIASAASSINVNLSSSAASTRSRRPSIFSRSGGSRLREASNFDGISSRSTLGSSTGLAAVGFGTTVADGGDHGHGPHPLVGEDHYSVLQLPHFACSVSFGESCTAGVEAVRAIYLQVLDHLMNPSSLNTAPGSNSSSGIGITRATTVSAAAVAVMSGRRTSLGRRSAEKAERPKLDPPPPMPRLQRVQTAQMTGSHAVDDALGAQVARQASAPADSMSLPPPTAGSARTGPAANAAAMPSPTLSPTLSQLPSQSQAPTSTQNDFVYASLSYGLPYALTPSGHVRQPVSTHAVALAGALLEAFTRFDKAATKFCTAVKDRLDDKAVELVEEGLDGWLAAALASR